MKLSSYQKKTVLSCGCALSDVQRIYKSVLINCVENAVETEVNRKHVINTITLVPSELFNKTC